jgi:GNAT superfamily N-acetyltransferase
MEIRYARPEDQRRVIELLGQFPPSDIAHVEWEACGETIQRIIRHPELGSILIAMEDGQAVGMITLSYPLAIRCGGVYTCIEEFVVGEKGRGKGIGGKLLGAALEEAKKKGCFELQVNNPSEQGYPVYLKYGLSDAGKHLKIVLAED